MYSSSDFEKLWFLYKTEGEPQGISINTFCLIHGVLYRYFNSWFVKTRKKIVPVQIEVIPSSDSALEAFLASVCVESALMQSNLEINSGNILVTIQTRNGLNISKCNLDYRGLKNFYYLLSFHDMRYKASCVSEIIRSRHHRDPLQGDVYIFISKDQKKVKQSVFL